MHAIEDFYTEERRARLAEQQGACYWCHGAIEADRLAWGAKVCAACSEARKDPERSRDLERTYIESLQDAQGCSDVPEGE